MHIDLREKGALGHGSSSHTIDPHNGADETVVRRMPRRVVRLLAVRVTIARALHKPRTAQDGERDVVGGEMHDVA